MKELLSMDAALLKDEITKKVGNINSPAILERLHIIVSDFSEEEQGKDFWDNLPEQLKESIRKAEQELNEGKGIPHEKVMNEIKARYKLME